MRTRRKHLRSALPEREQAICRRLIEARKFLGLDQAAVARKVGIPKSTIASYELGISPLKSEVALRICRGLILSEEWLATGLFTMTEQAVGLASGSSPKELHWIFLRQCMDLMNSPEAAALARGTLFSDAYDSVLVSVFRDRVKAHYYEPGIPASSWSSGNIELGFDINSVLVERFVRLLQNEALRRGCSPEHAAATYLGFLMRMAIFGFKKSMEWPVTAEQLGLPTALFEKANIPITAFRSKEAVYADRTYVPVTNSVK